MIYDVCQLVKADLRSRKYPHPVSYGPERAERNGFQLGVVFSRDRQAGDEIAAPQGWQPRDVGKKAAPFQRWIAGQCLIYARSSVRGAAVQDHEDEADKVEAGIISALYRLMTAHRTPLQIVESRLLAADEFNDSEIWAGAAKRLRFRVAEPVLDLDYLGGDGGTGTVADVETVATAETAPGD